MDRLWASITEWLKEVLINGITSNLAGMFDSTNQHIGEIAGNVGTTPQAWNGSVFSMIQNLSGFFKFFFSEFCPDNFEWKFV